MTKSERRMVVKGWGREPAAAPDDGRETFTYKPLSSSFVPGETKRAVEVALVIACADLKMPEPALVWFEKAQYPHRLPSDIPTFTRREVRGVADAAAKAIGVRADLVPADAAETAAHECRHLAQPKGRDHLAADEPEAAAYGQKVRRIFTDILYGDRSPRVHHLDRNPGKSNVLYGVAERGDVLIAPGLDGEPIAWVNFGLKRSPRWRPVSAGAY